MQVLHEILTLVDEDNTSLSPSDDHHSVCGNSLLLFSIWQKPAPPCQIALNMYQSQSINMAPNNFQVTAF